VAARWSVSVITNISRVKVPYVPERGMYRTVWGHKCGHPYCIKYANAKPPLSLTSLP
jgi:hypothetical protein